jgi:hypothetical protein
MDSGQFIEAVIGVIGDSLDRYNASPRILETVSESIHRVSAAVNRVTTLPFVNQLSAAEVIEKLKHAIDWRECKSIHI